MKYFLILLSVFSYGQQTVKVLYEVKKNISAEFIAQLPLEIRAGLAEQLKKPDFKELINNGEFSIVKSLPAKDIVLKSEIPDTATEKYSGISTKAPKSFIFKDFTANNCFTEYTISGKTVYVKDDVVEKSRLIFDNKTLMIDNYKCKSAKCAFTEKDTVQYWYTQDIPIIDGPLQMSNVPGLILRIESKGFTATAIKIEFFDKKLVVEGLNKKYPIISSEEYNKLRAKSVETITTDDGNGTKMTKGTKSIKF
jgi:GLPGLI family protein